MKLSPQEKARLLEEPRCVELLRMFPLPEGKHVTTVLLSHLPKMSDRAFEVFKEFLTQQSGVECGLQGLHLEQIGRLATFLVVNSEQAATNLQKALIWLSEGKIGLASTSTVSSHSQSFWHCMREK